MITTYLSIGARRLLAEVCASVGKKTLRLLEAVDASFKAPQLSDVGC